MGNIEQFFCEELKRWQTAADNYKRLQEIITASVDCGEYQIRLQFNPARIVSTGAKIDATTIKERKCFLCEANRVPEQKYLPWRSEKGTHEYQICINPFPIFKRHFTVADAQHTPQLIAGRVSDLLSLAQSFPMYTAFYNGPKSGASAPDHAHFQLIPQGEMPIEQDCKNPHLVVATEHPAVAHFKSNYMRSATHIKVTSKAEAVELLEQELSKYQVKEYNLIFMPRTEHRPKQFFLEEPEKIMFSPGAVDMGGLIIAPRGTDFEKYKSAQLLKELYAQVSPTTK